MGDPYPDRRTMLERRPERQHQRHSKPHNSCDDGHFSLGASHGGPDGGSREQEAEDGRFVHASPFLWGMLFLVQPEHLSTDSKFTTSFPDPEWADPEIQDR